MDGIRADQAAVIAVAEVIAAEAAADVITEAATTARAAVDVARAAAMKATETARRVASEAAARAGSLRPVESVEGHVPVDLDLTDHETGSSAADGFASQAQIATANAAAMAVAKIAVAVADAAVMTAAAAKEAASLLAYQLSAIQRATATELTGGDARTAAEIPRQQPEALPLHPQRIVDPSREHVRDAAAEHRDMAADARDKAFQAEVTALLLAQRELLAAAALDRAAAAADRQEAALRAEAAAVRAEIAEAREAHFISAGRLDESARTSPAAGDRAASALDRRDAARDREDSRAILHNAYRDGLTGTLLRDAGRDQLRLVMDHSRRKGEPLSLAFLDIDGLKKINDTQGHSAGDLVLQAVGQALRRRLRTYDVIVRWGGDEFVCALPGTTLAMARHRLRTITKSLAPVTTLSIGLVEPTVTEELEQAIGRADREMYETRRDRNR